MVAHNAGYALANSATAGQVIYGFDSGRIVGAPVHFAILWSSGGDGSGRLRHPGPGSSLGSDGCVVGLLDSQGDPLLRPVGRLVDGLG